VAAAALTLSLSASGALASNYTIDWMNMTPTPFGSPPPLVSSYTLPGIGVVQMTYTAHSDFVDARHQIPQLTAGSLNYSGDNYAWTDFEMLARTNWGFSGVVNSSWSVTYTFPGTVPAGSLYLGVMGLGRRDPLPGESVLDATTVATVLQNGTHYGDFTGALNVGPTQFTPSAGMFQMQNSLTGPGGADPWWNTGMAVVEINDAVNALTVHFDQTSGDGVGVNIGVLVPEPCTAGLLGCGALMVVRRRKARAIGA
jgi:hypothetical protein